MKKITNYFKNTLKVGFLILVTLIINGAAATFTVTNTNDSGAGSLRQAVLDANAAASADTIVFDAAVFSTPQTITLAVTAITISPAASVDTLTITGPGANLLTIVSTAPASQRIFINGANNNSADTTSISGITFAQSVGGNIINSANLTVTNCAFVNNNSSVNGVGILNNIAAANLIVDNSVFSGNSGSNTGGAISNDGTATITNSTFISNTSGAGGAISNNGSLSVSNSAFTNNTATNGSATGLGGGAVYSFSSVETTAATITNSVFTANAEVGGSGGGGAIRNRDGSMTISNSNFFNNTGLAGGGAIQNSDILSISGSTFSGNSASGPNGQQTGEGNGGAISNTSGGQSTIADSVITGNAAINHGGGIYYQTNSDGALMDITNTTISNNVANTNNNLTGSGGGFYIVGIGVVTVTGSTISGNRANRNLQSADLRFSGNGGGFFVQGALTLDNSTVSGNFAELSYGGIEDSNPGGSQDQVHISNSTIVNNRAGVGCGGFGISSASDAGQQSLRNSIIANNSASGATIDICTASSLNSLGYNLIKNITDATISGTTTGNIYEQDPQLGPLSFNGGATRTHALLTGSPAIDMGDPTTFPATDQRGIARPQNGDNNGGSIADIGAYERRFVDILSHQISDFDGDGKTDLSIFRPSAGEWWYLRSSDGGNRAFQFGAGTDKIVPADYTGDGKTDVAIWRPSTGEWFILRSEDNSFYSFPFGSAGDIPTPADFDSDGIDDPAVFRPSTGNWFIIRSSDGGTTITTFGSAGDQPVAADYDGDGFADIAIFRPSDGTWWLNRSSAGVVVTRFGTSSDKTVQADYTGDGKADVAFWRPSTGEWFILRSEDFSFYSFPFGTTGDIPAPGDYDGDGIADVAIFRPSTGTWYISGSTSGTQIAGFGTAGDQPAANAYVR